MKNNLDLRVIKTKENIRESMLELLSKKSIYEITVKEICDRAKCSRNTFYLHYPYKEILYEEIIDECIEKVHEGFSPIHREPNEPDRAYTGRIVHNIVSSMYSVKDEINAIVSSDRTNTFFAKLTQVVRETAISSSVEVFPGFKKDEYYGLIADFCAAGVVNYMLGCFKAQSVTPEDAENLLVDLLSEPFALSIRYIEKHK